MCKDTSSLGLSKFKPVAQDLDSGDRIYQCACGWHTKWLKNGDELRLAAAHHIYFPEVTNLL